MINKRGFPINKREMAIEEIKQILIDHAKSCKLITYSKLSNQVKSIRLKPPFRPLYKILEEISIAEDKSGRGLLTALVVRKDTGLPGQGFFDLASSRGRDTTDKKKCWKDELKRVKQSGKKNKPSASS